jgi:hypothetical protein
MDFEKLHLCQENKDKSLQKSWDFFKSDKLGVRYRGRESYGPFSKQTKAKDFPKKYYLAPHAREEYFALEILQYLGIDTPKARLIKDDKATILVATKSIPDYIPRDGVILENMTAFQMQKEKAYEQDSSQENVPALLEMRQRYRLDIRRQIFRDVQLKKEYKISGNLFAFDLMLTVVADPDAMAFTNFGFHLLNGRCFAIAIDKDQATFKGLSYQKLCDKVDDRIYQDNDQKAHIASHMFYYREREQLLDVLYRLQQGLVLDSKTKLSPFDQIFLNQRVQKTGLFCQFPYKAKCENFKKSVRSTLEFYAERLEPNYLEAYAHREKIRELISDLVLERIKIINDDREFIKKTIIEDLRGPYYKSFFHGKFPSPLKPISGTEWETERNRRCIHVSDVKNEWLIRAITKNVKKEFRLSASPVVPRSYHYS